MQLGYDPKTYADIRGLELDFNYIPKININLGIKIFVDWFKDYYEK